MISPTLWKNLFISLLMIATSVAPSVIPQIGKQQPLHSVDLDKITSWSNTWNMSFNPDKSQTLTLSLRKDHLENPPIYFLNNPLEGVLSFKLLGLTICHDLSEESYISSWPPKPVTEWASSVVQSPSLAHLSS